MRKIAIVQARMSSSRLPGKVLEPLAGKPALYHIHERLSGCKLIDKIVIATSKDSSDDVIDDFCQNHNISCLRGSLDDVLDRFYQTAVNYKADLIIRITGDCPVIDPVIVDSVIAGFLGGSYDFYGLGGEFPDGLDCTVFSFKSIQMAWRDAKLPSEREHVGPYIEKNPEIFKGGVLNLYDGLSSMRWTLDELADLELLKIIFEKLYSENKIFYTHEILELMNENPQLSKINQDIVRNEGYSKSLLLEQELDNE
jgi:spore coat polysaccharide biosynthesis protein SpsF